jgi:hypothetical protein
MRLFHKCVVMVVHGSGERQDHPTDEACRNYGG